MSKNPKKIPNIGFIIPSVDQYYEREMISKLFFTMETRACNLHVFCGQSIPAEDPASTYGDLVSVLPAADFLDGLIVTTASIINYVPLNHVTMLIDQYKDIPIVSVSYPLENTYNILLDNEVGIREIMTHLVETHGFKDIVHIAGPKWSLEAKARAKAFLFMLQRYGLIKDNKRIIHAGFTRDTGKIAAQILLSDYKELPEAVVCCSDEVAFGLARELETRGIRTPDDIAITGFDNVIWSRFATPAITTANQPLDKMMSQALTILLDLYEGKTPPKEHIFRTDLVIRESCSCREIKKNIINIKTMLDEIPSLNFERAESDEQTFRKNQALMLDILKASLGGAAAMPKGVDRFLLGIFEALVTDFCQKSAPIRLSVAVERFFVWTHRPHYEELEWKTLDFTIEAILKALFPQPEKKQFLDHFCLQFVYSLDMITHKIYNRDLFEQYDQSVLASQVINHFSAVTSYEQMLLAFRANCSILSFKECYCCLLESPILMNEFYNIHSVRNITMVFGKYQNEHLAEIAFTTDTMLPESILEKGGGQSLAYFALNTGNLYYGYFACDLDNMLKPLAGTVRQQLSSILDRLDLLDKLEEDTQKIMRISLQDALTGLLNRRGFFEEGQRILLEALEKKQEMTLLFGDMDNLKAVNDTYGHQSGDLALKSIALCLKDALREGDIVSRFGGDEFALLLRGNDSVKNIGLVITRIQSHFEQFNRLSTLPYDIRISFGYATKQKSERKDLETMIEEADRRLYDEKSRHKAGDA